MKETNLARYARYYSTPDKVRAALINSFGRAPTIEEISIVMAKQNATRSREIGEPSDRDALDYAPRARNWSALVNGAPRKQAPRKDDFTALKRAVWGPEKDISAAEQKNETEEALEAMRRAARKLPFSEKLVFEVCDELDIDVKKFKSASRIKRYVHARAVVAMLLREANPLLYSYPKIAQIVGRKDHSTIIHAVDNFAVYCRQDARLWPLYKALGGKRATP